MVVIKGFCRGGIRVPVAAAVAAFCTERTTRDLLSCTLVKHLQSS